MSASHLVVVDSRARRAVVKVSPGTHLSDVLQEARSKLGLGAEQQQYALRHNNKLIDLSRTVRLSGLSSGAKLELVLLSRSPSAVSVALQLPPSEVRPGDDDAPNGRLVDKFVSTTTLWHVLRRFESAAPPPPSAAGSTGSGGSGGSGRRSRNFTARGVPRMNTSGAAADGEQIGSEGAGSGSGRLYYETPVLQYMGRELATFAHLQKSLAELGLTSGTALLRLSFRPTAQPLEEAMSEIERYFHSATGSSSSGGGGGGASGAHAGSAGSAESVPDAGNADAMMPLDDVGGGVGGGGDGAKSPALSSPAAEEEADPMAAGVPAPAYAEGGSAAGVDELEVPEETIVGPDNRPMSIFAPPSNTTPQATKHDFNEADYEFTVDHARQHQARLAQSGRNRRLPSEAERRAHEAAAAERRARVRAVELKIRFPDQTQVVSTFSAADTAAALYAFVRSVLRHADQPFVLTYSSPAGPRIVPGADGGRQMEGKGRGADDGGESTATGGSGGGGGGGGGGGDGGDGSVRLIQDLGFSGRMLINFAWHERASVDARLAASAAGSLLKPEFAAAARELRVEDVKPVVEDSGSGNDASSSSSMNNGPAAANVGGGASSSSSSSKKGIPKWLKLPGKK